MPKEFIECADFGRRVPLAGKEGDLVEFGEMDTLAVKVGWTRDRGHVELAVVESVDGAYVEHPSLSMAITESAGPYVSVPAQVGNTGPLYIQLDRAGLNRLIRTLRKARDAAFGSDA